MSTHLVDEPFNIYAYLLALVVLFVGLGIPYMMIKGKSVNNTSNGSSLKLNRFFDQLRWFINTLLLFFFFLPSFREAHLRTWTGGRSVKLSGRDWVDDRKESVKGGSLSLYIQWAAKSPGFFLGSILSLHYKRPRFPTSYSIITSSPTLSFSS